MIFRRILMAVVAIAMFAAGTAIAVFALAFGLYALVEPRLGRAGAAATVALVTAALMIMAGLFLAWTGRRKPPKAGSSTAASLIERALDFLGQKPIVSATAAIGVGIMAIRNPKYLGSVLRAFLDGRPPPK